jgi:hypothetical protein
MLDGFVIRTGWFWLILVLWTPAIRAETFEIYPPAGCEDGEEFENMANGLNPGDELILHGGGYCQTGRRYVNRSGTQAQPIIIRAADGETPVLTRLDDPTGPQSQNGIEIEGSYLKFRGIHFEHGETGVQIKGGSTHITIEDCEISQTANNALTFNSGDTDSCVIRRNHIHHTGLLDSQHGDTEGEGMYVGCNNASCIASNHVIEGNYIHDLRSTSGGGNDGVEIKYGSFGNLIRDNVIHTTTIGTSYPCILVYGVRNQDIGSPNIVEGNALWDCGQAIQVSADAIIRNNLILDSQNGVTATGHAQVPQLRNVIITHNTIHGHQSEAMYIRWAGAPGMVLANNAIYNPGGQALNATGLEDATVKANYVQGSGATVDDNAFYDGSTAAAAFVDTGSMNFWPAVDSPLLNNADPNHAASIDFNGNSRTAPFDVGAYETEGLSINPGWQVQPGFKDTNLEPDTIPPKAPTGFTVNPLN